MSLHVVFDPHFPSAHIVVTGAVRLAIIVLQEELFDLVCNLLSRHAALCLIVGSQLRSSDLHIAGITLRILVNRAE